MGLNDSSSTSTLAEVVGESISGFCDTASCALVVLVTAWVSGIDTMAGDVSITTSVVGVDIVACFGDSVIGCELEESFRAFFTSPDDGEVGFTFCLFKVFPVYSACCATSTAPQQM
eukprot:snap_masked-scaffold_2-processed-gene-15.11-mRNA-1 protein AED:1.00 eAED:1.00 QI:0/-1/0/0/-1/1/1/0/115